MNMTASRLKRAFVSFLSMMLALQLVLPNVALAAQREVELDNHTMETDQTSQISDIYIDDVDGPKTGTQLDDEAVVTTAEKKHVGHPPSRGCVTTCRSTVTRPMTGTTTCPRSRSSCLRSTRSATTPLP